MNTATSLPTHQHFPIDLRHFGEARPEVPEGAHPMREQASVSRSELFTALDVCGVAALLASADGVVTFSTEAAGQYLGPRLGVFCETVVPDLVRELLHAGRARIVVEHLLNYRIRGEAGERALRVRASCLHGRDDGVLVVMTHAVRPQVEAVARDRRSLLTQREREIAHLIAEAHAYGDIAARLSISLHTVRRHTERIFSKFGVRTRAQLMAALRR